MYYSRTQERGRARSRRFKTFLAPTRGWVTNEPLAAAQMGGARLLENFFPTQTGIRMRRGAFRVATVGDAAESLFAYVSGGTTKIFAASETDIYDVTAPADPDVAPSADVSSQTSGYYSTAQIGTAGGEFLIAVNGTDDAQSYDGSAWAVVNGGSTPAITGVGTDDLSAVWLYANRLFFVEGGTTSAWYLPVDSIGGAATEFSLRGVFKRGGSLLFGASWSSDSGDGMDDRCVFVSALGEVVVYVGTDPSSASTWQLQGRYDIPEPLGRNAFQQVGGDLLIMTREGIIPMSQVVAKDPAALSLSAISRAIETDWKREVSIRTSLPWEFAKWDEGNMGIVTLPTEYPDSTAYAGVFVVNLETGAWAKFTGWDARCVLSIGRKAYFGTNGGRILEVERGGDDDGMPYLCRASFAPDHLGEPATLKVARLARAIFQAQTESNPRLSISTDYAVGFPASLPAAGETETSVWDSGLWDVAAWDGAAPRRTSLRWQGVTGQGIVVAPQVQILQGSATPPEVELVSFDLLYEQGGLVV